MDKWVSAAPLQPHLPEAAAKDPYLEFTCEDCDCILTTKEGLGTHRRVVHGMAIMNKSCIWGSRRQTCDKEFLTRPRLLKHMAYDAALSCGASFLASEPLHLPPEVIVVWMRATWCEGSSTWRRGCRRDGLTC